MINPQFKANANRQQERGRDSGTVNRSADEWIFSQGVVLDHGQMQILLKCVFWKYLLKHCCWYLKCM